MLTIVLCCPPAKHTLMPGSENSQRLKHLLVKRLQYDRVAVRWVTPGDKCKIKSKVLITFLLPHLSLDGATMLTESIETSSSYCDVCKKQKQVTL